MGEECVGMFVGVCVWVYDLNININSCVYGWDGIPYDIC